MHKLVDINVPKGAVAIHWFEQASFAVKDASGTIVFVDPYFPHDRPASTFLHATPPVNEAELPVAYVLLTHEHGDHTHPETVNRIRQSSPRARFVGPIESVNLIVRECAVDPANTVTIEAGRSVALGSMTAHAVYAKPPAGDAAANIAPPDVTHLGYVLKAGAVTLYFSGDLIHNFADHDALVQPVAAHRADLGFITCHPTEGEFPFFAGAVKIAQRTGLVNAAPAHYACFVARDYDPVAWAAEFPAGGPEPLLIPRNSHIIYHSKKKA